MRKDIIITLVPVPVLRISVVVVLRLRMAPRRSKRSKLTKVRATLLPVAAQITLFPWFMVPTVLTLTPVTALVKFRLLKLKERPPVMSSMLNFVDCSMSVH